MWQTLLAINSIIFWPASVLFLVYATGRMILTWEWKMFVVAAVLWAIFTIIEVVLGMMAD